MDPVLTLPHLPLSRMLTLLEILTPPNQPLVFVLLMGGGAVSWSSKLQSRVARSTTEAEFIAGESCTRDMAFLGYNITLPQPLGMVNQSAIRVAKNPEHQGRMRHLNLIYYGFREEEAGEISPHFVPTVDMPADILT